MGIIVSATALFVILSVFTGLKELSVSFTNSTDPDLKISAAKGKSFSITPEEQNKLVALKGITTFSKVVEERVLFYFDEKQEIAYLKGVDSLFTKVNQLDKHLAGGEWLTQETNQVVVGAGISLRLSLGLFDFNRNLEIIVPKPGKGVIQNPEDGFTKTYLTPVGIYVINEDLDNKYVFSDLGLAQELLHFGNNQVTGIEIKLSGKQTENEVMQSINQIFGDKVIVKNRIQLNDALYKMLNAENLVVYLFCSLVVIMTLFCLAGALIMLIIDKRENIKTLFNLGVQIKGLRKIFLYQGIFITVSGLVFGLVLGSVIILIQQHYSIIMITATLPYPVQFTIMNLIIVIATILVLGFFASWIASSRVSKKLLE